MRLNNSCVVKSFVSANVCALFMFSVVSVASEHARSVTAQGQAGKTDHAVNAQSRVVYYRAVGKDIHPGVASIFLDDEFVTALSPGSYTDFCVQPGPHSLGAYFNAAPVGVRNVRVADVADLRGGVTYYLRVAEKGDGVSVYVDQGQAVKESAGYVREGRLLSRASQAEPCAITENSNGN